VEIGSYNGGGTLSIAGTYTQTSVGVLEEYFRTTLNISSTATLAGALDLIVNPRCPPPVGSTATALSYGSRSGAFATHSSGFGLSYGAHALTVTYQG
jgi:hypothetical protein